MQNYANMNEIFWRKKKNVNNMHAKHYHFMHSFEIFIFVKIFSNFI